MTREEIHAERSWLSRKANRLNPNFMERLTAFNRAVEEYNKGVNLRARTAIKTLKVGDVVYVREEFNRKGLFRIEKIMQKNIIIKAMSDTQTTQRLRCSADVVRKVEAEDESLVNALDDIGLI